jgi:hypothetical protein
MSGSVRATSLRRMDGGHWELSDAWLLLAAAHGGRRGRDLSRLIAVADAYNHDIPTEQVIERSVGRLIASGLARGSEGLRVRLTSDGQQLVKRVKRLGMFEQVPALQLLLGSKPLIEGRWPLPPGAWQSAYDRYYPPERRNRA